MSYTLTPIFGTGLFLTHWLQYLVRASGILCTDLTIQCRRISYILTLSCVKGLYRVYWHDYLLQTCFFTSGKLKDNTWGAHEPHSATTYSAAWHNRKIPPVAPNTESPVVSSWHTCFIFKECRVCSWHRGWLSWLKMFVVTFQVLWAVTLNITVICDV